ncbi:MAG: YdcF family protein [Acidimicrobiales bacterium]
MFFTVFRWLRRVVYLVVLVVFVYFVVTSVQVVTASRTPLPFDHVKPAAAIIVIGSPTGSTISADLQLRCTQALSLWRAGRAGTIITTGASSASGAPTEASVAAAYLEHRGVKRVTMVPLARIPGQLSFVAQLLPKASGGRVILLADPLQTKWLTDVAASDSLQAQVAATPASKGSFMHDLGTLWGQSIAVGVGRVVGYQNTGWAGG